VGIGGAMAKIGSRIGKGLKVDIYIPKGNLWIVREIQRRVAAVKKLGYRTSFNFELILLLKSGLTQERVLIQRYRNV